MEADPILQEILSQKADVIAFHFDIDGTMLINALPKEAYDLDGVGNAALMKKLDPTKYEEIEHANLEMVVSRVIDGKPMSGITGREAPFLLGDYLREMVEQRAEEEGLQRVNGRLIGKNGRPMILTMSSMSGVWSYDVLDPDHGFIEPGTVQKVPHALLMGLDYYADLFRASTPEKRMRLIEQTTPQWVGTNWDYALISPTWTRVNLAIDHEMIIASKDLTSKWRELTGVKIKGRIDLLKALKFFEEKWGVSIHGANNHVAVDIVAKGVNKSIARERVHRHIKRVYEEFGIEINSIGQISIGDSPDGNDKAILQGENGVSVVEPLESVDGYPYFFNRLPAGIDPEVLTEKQKQIYRTFAFMSLMDEYEI